MIINLGVFWENIDMFLVIIYVVFTGDAFDTFIVRMW